MIALTWIGGWQAKSHMLNHVTQHYGHYNNADSSISSTEVHKYLHVNEDGMGPYTLKKF